MSNCLLHTTRCPFTHNTCYTAEAPQKPHARAADSPDTVPTDTHTQRARELKSSDSHNVLASRWSFPCPAPLPHIKYLRYLTCPRRYLPAPYRAPRFAIPRFSPHSAERARYPPGTHHMQCVPSRAAIYRTGSLAQIDHLTGVHLCPPHVCDADSASDQRDDRHEAVLTATTTGSHTTRAIRQKPQKPHARAADSPRTQSPHISDLSSSLPPRAPPRPALCYSRTHAELCGPCLCSPFTRQRGHYPPGTVRAEQGGHIS